MKTTNVIKQIRLHLLPVLVCFGFLLFSVNEVKAITLDTLTVGSEGYALTETTTVTGDVTVQGGILNINGKTLTIQGSLTLTGEASRLQMAHPSDPDMVEVWGNVTFNGASTKDYLTKGILKIGEPCGADTVDKHQRELFFRGP